MSTYYNVKCLKCDVELFERGCRNRKQPILWLIKNAEDLVIAERIFASAPSEIERSFEIFSAGWVDVSWLQTHQPHGLVMCDDHGKIVP